MKKLALPLILLTVILICCTPQEAKVVSNGLTDVNDVCIFEQEVQAFTGGLPAPAAADIATACGIASTLTPAIEQVIADLTPQAQARAAALKARRSP